MDGLRSVTSITGAGADVGVVLFQDGLVAGVLFLLVLFVSTATNDPFIATNCNRKIRKIQIKKIENSVKINSVKVFKIEKSAKSKWFGFSKIKLAKAKNMRKYRGGKKKPNKIIKNKN